jgi:hypothetical protein
MKLGTGITIAFLLIAALVEWRLGDSVNHFIAEKYIGECESIPFPNADAFQSSTKTVIIFNCDGSQGSIDALFILSKDEIEKLVILKSNEGLNKAALNNTTFLTSFEQDRHNLPLDVDAISGATISSQIIIDEMNQHIKEWNIIND